MHSKLATLLKTVRLEQDTIEKLSRLFREHLQDYPDAVVYLFGSRTDLRKKGGDLDLLIVSQRAISHAYELRKKLRMAIKEELGDQRVDILISPDPHRNDQPAFIRLAVMEGVRIWP
ncbi:MAG: nucleotidyltransferase domain-containing protein [Anaerolineales bacterium]|nr:nucleotidyltransferase domain-containing protein [Anaerolineales bacterium]